VAILPGLPIGLLYTQASTVSVSPFKYSN